MIDKSIKSIQAVQMFQYQEFLEYRKTTDFQLANIKKTLQRFQDLLLTMDTRFTDLLHQPQQSPSQPEATPIISPSALHLDHFEIITSALDDRNASLENSVDDVVPLPFEVAAMVAAGDHVQAPTVTAMAGTGDDQSYFSIKLDCSFFDSPKSQVEGEIAVADADKLTFGFQQPACHPCSLAGTVEPCVCHVFRCSKNASTFCCHFCAIEGPEAWLPRPPPEPPPPIHTHLRP